MNKKGTIVLVVLVQVVLVALACWGLVKHRSNYINEERIEVSSLKQQWGSGIFVKLDQPEYILVNNINLLIQSSNTNGVISSDMMRQLNTTLLRMLTAFNKGDENAYRKFHFPIGPTQRSIFDTNRMAIIRKAAKNDMDFISRTNIDNMSDQDLFVSWGYELYKKLPPEVRGCVKCWEGANFSRADIKYVIVTNIAQVEENILLGFNFPKQFNEEVQAISSFDSIVTFHPTPVEVLNDMGELIIASARIPLKTTAGKIGFYPLYAKFYWSPKDKAWIPIGLALPSTEMNMRIWF